MEDAIIHLEKEVSAPAFWDNSVVAQRKMKSLYRMREDVEGWRGLESQVQTVDDLLAIALEEEDNSLYETFVQETTGLGEKLDGLEFRLALSGEHDARNAIVAIHAGAGGVESQDWAEMLMRMYLRWSERRGFQTSVLDTSYGEEAGIKSAIVQFNGDYAYGYLKAERGVHRLVRMSPFDSDHARHTSFALVEVLPEAEEGIDITVDPNDLKVEVFKAGGAGGQSVQKNSTAVRITHMPTGIKVSCQNERSQHQNKTIAMRVLTARLMERDNQERVEEMNRLRGEHISPEWGNQIRSYVLHPYKMVKDHRTGHETSDTDSVLNGEIDNLISSYLTSTIGKDEQRLAVGR